jgi:hypothetical protein|uniref:Uncharacterized protein n=1 Tax=Zea mays TaxID=4577 RepID=C0PI07_MAIZE|nr:unknown [Zea mays]
MDHDLNVSLGHVQPRYYVTVLQALDTYKKPFHSSYNLMYLSLVSYSPEPLTIQLIYVGCMGRTVSKLRKP